jgi:hypothetical protein
LYKAKCDTINQCIYCGSIESLSDEHVLPYGLGGDIVLKKASCLKCAKITGQLEQRLLRGHWWPYRQFLGLKSRRSKTPVPNLKVMVERFDGSEINATIPMLKQSLAIGFELFPPSILEGKERTEIPYAKNAYMKPLGPTPSVVRIEGKLYRLSPLEKITIPVNFEAGELCRFLAKVAHGFAISRRGLEACSDYFLPPIILGEVAGAMTYVGGANSPIIGSLLPCTKIHALMDRINGQYLTVYIQLFRDGGDPPPIYEVVVGKLKQQMLD